ncbi:hypothetical protein [Gordonia polyisoprenivorans]|uniref:Uncharacterized protein n=1 Tax=Gordonia polyisoprenivorans TaxID=84595 RepID=A0A846WS33_9ACTN|nr:hypothetical protein [Gordonia polyisoprenivorans]MBE7194621.1 hypothetical protein [Gordonia polyisoprenivorans]NKY04382.1 hypothetical protein [Gordonia polyisoprenivorans]QUD83064.1 hypothetical protein J8M97_26095 [Gordonia polyisoprenivorans]UZF56094.1 hypothetical protein LH935_26010 [Gordonia polyisoprenivorans]WCB37150.1 hypothetical protein PHA63_24405 [Gordonia polyisoprenivorans]
MTRPQLTMIAGAILAAFGTGGMVARGSYTEAAIVAAAWLILVGLFFIVRPRNDAEAS